MLATILERVKRSVTAGKSLEQVKAERPTKEWDERFPRSFVTSDHVVEEALSRRDGAQVGADTVAVLHGVGKPNPGGSRQRGRIER